MKCGRVRDLFSRHLENAMDGALYAGFDEHLAACSACREAYERFGATVVMLDEMPEVEPPADFHASVMARVEQTRRTAPHPVRWWRIDWQHVFTIRVPARAVALGVAVLLLAAVVFQLTPVGQAGMALFFGPSKPAANPISDVPTDNPRIWYPWHSGAQNQAGLLIGVKMDANNVYSIRLGAGSHGAVAFTMNANESSYSGVVAANRDSVIRVPAPSSRLTVAKVTWSYADRRQEESIFLPAKLESRASPKSFTLQSTSVREALRRIVQEYGVVIIASGDLSKTVPYSQVDQLTPAEALYFCLQDTGMKSKPLASSVFAVEPAR